MPGESGFHPPCHRGITHRTIGVSHTESRGFTHRPFQQAIEIECRIRAFLPLNLLKDSYLTESFNVNIAPSIDDRRGQWNRPMADELSFRAAFGVTEAAQAPQRLSGKKRARSGRYRTPAPLRSAVRAGKGPWTQPTRLTQRTSPAAPKSAMPGLLQYCSIRVRGGVWIQAVDQEIPVRFQFSHVGAVAEAGRPQQLALPVGGVAVDAPGEEQDQAEQG